ncbi:hypothetical protein [Enterococcus devriesei]|uniref:hypothetical protein n=1 Tax=Enterococcus devriesei TaxID=319970 RepID=UPI0036D2ADF1
MKEEKLTVKIELTNVEETIAKAERYVELLKECQRTLLNVVFWPLKHVGFRPSKMLVFGP